MNTDTTNYFAGDVDSIIWLIVIAFIIYAIMATGTLDIIKRKTKKK